MKRYILFEIIAYYPAGGAGDEHSRYDSLEEACKKANSLDDYCEILDLHTGTWLNPVDVSTIKPRTSA